MDGVKDLLLELLFIVLPIFIYQIFWVDNFHKQKRGGTNRTGLIITLLASISLVLCMTFPIHMLPGYILDLRVIPFIIGIFYGGYRVVIALTVMLLFYRFLIGGAGFYATLIVTASVLGVFLSLIRYFNRVSKQKKIAVVSMLSTVTAVFITLTCFYLSSKSGYSPPLEKEVLSKFALYILLHPIAGSLAVFLIESLREKRFMQMEMQRMEKMRVLGDLATSVAHEIRNPMTVARGFLQFLKVPEEQKPFIDLAIKEVDKIEAIINDYLYVTRPEVEQLESIQVEDIVKHTITVMQPYAALHKAELVLRHIESDIMIKAQKDKFIQLLINLVKNAIDSTGDGGFVKVRVLKKKKNVVIQVSDNGAGMTREEMLNLGFPFYSIKEEGTDLGLMFCYRFVEMLDGNIEVKSQKGRGTEFTVKIPASESA